MQTQLVYNGRDNAIDLVLLADGVAVSVSLLTRVIVEIGESTLDSDALGLGAGEEFDNTITKAMTSGDLKGQTVQVLRLSLGGESIAAGRHQAKLTIYDVDHAAGLVWTEGLPVEVMAA